MNSNQGSGLVINNNNNLNVNDSVKLDKVQNNRTSHTRFFQRLYGHLENDSNKSPQKIEENSIKLSPNTNNNLNSNKSSEILLSPSESSELSSSSPDLNHNSEQKHERNLQNFQHNYDIGLPAHFPGNILPSHFRPLIGLSPADANHHFAAFLARRRRKEGRQRRQRTTFSSDQTLRLEVEFNRNEYISRGRRFELAETLHLSETQIKIWFQNRRAKDKRIEKAQIDQQYRNFAAVNGLLPFGIGQYAPPPPFLNPQQDFNLVYDNKSSILEPPIGLSAATGRGVNP